MTTSVSAPAARPGRIALDLGVDLPRAGIAPDELLGHTVRATATVGNGVPA